jgi:EmrB/QacA subfamily drug resistance transporter
VSDRRKLWILLNVSVGVFMATLDGSIANVGLPTISAHLHVALHTVQWVVSSYLLAICAMLPIVGKLADLFGRGRLYNWGFLIFSLGSALCALSGTIGFLVGARVLQAIGASLLMANSQAIITTTFPAEERGRALGINGTTVSLGSLVGPVAGGLLIAWFGWSSIFWINVPIGIVGFWLGLWMLPKGRAAVGVTHFDLVGSSLFIIGIVAVLYSISQVDVWGWTSMTTLLGVGTGFGVLLGFRLWEGRVTQPMIDFGLYRIRLFLTGSLAAFLSFMSLYITNTIMPFYLEDVIRASPETTGWTMAAYPLAMAFVAPISGWLSDHIGPYWLTTAGLMINAGGFISLNALSASAATWVIALHLAVFGIGQGMFQSPNNSSVMGSVPRAKVGSAGGLNALVRNIGMVMGISLSVALFSSRLRQIMGGAYTGVPQDAPHPAFMTALHTVFWGAAVGCVLGAGLSSLRGSAGRP